MNAFWKYQINALSISLKVKTKIEFGPKWDIKGGGGEIALAMGTSWARAIVRTQYRSVGYGTHYRISTNIDQMLTKCWLLLINTPYWYYW